MKIMLLRNAAKEYGCELREGEIGEVAQSLATKLVSLGIAVDLDQIDALVETKPAKKKTTTSK